VAYCAHQKATASPQQRPPLTSVPDQCPDDQVEAWQQAIEYFREGYRLQEEGDLAAAMQQYRRSIRLYPTAEAHTFLGWTYSSLQLYAEAIAECKQAIRVDPDLGNPYNDIGAYLMELGRYSEAIPWFKKAITARRYNARAYPFYNLGRVYERLGNWPRAIRCYRQALDIHPDYRQARIAWQELRARLN
jgi:tetratricopeptide (TPR) repeat protein